MNYKKMKPEKKLRYVYNHISTVKEWAEIAKQHLDWTMEHIDFIREISEYEDVNN